MTRGVVWIWGRVHKTPYNQNSVLIGENFHTSSKLEMPQNQQDSWRFRV